MTATTTTPTTTTATSAAGPSAVSEDPAPAAAGSAPAAAGPDLAGPGLVGMALIGDEATDGCCSLSRTPVDAPTAEVMATRFKVLSDPTRLLLLSHIAARGCESVCACDLLDVVDISQPTVSHHLKRLVDAGLLAREQRGKWAHYTVVRSALDDLRGFLDLS